MNYYRKWAYLLKISIYREFSFILIVKITKISFIGDNGPDCSIKPNPLCQTTSWSEFSPCSASCDDGIRVRTRLFFYAEHVQECSAINLIEKEKCNVYSCNRLQSTYSDGWLFVPLIYKMEIIRNLPRREGRRSMWRHFSALLVQ